MLRPSGTNTQARDFAYPNARQTPAECQAAREALRWWQAEELCRRTKHALVRDNKTKPEGQAYIMATLGYCNGRDARWNEEDEGGYETSQALPHAHVQGWEAACYWIGYWQTRLFKGAGNHFNDEQLFAVCVSIWPGLWGEVAA